MAANLIRAREGPMRDTRLRGNSCLGGAFWRAERKALIATKEKGAGPEMVRTVAATPATLIGTTRSCQVCHHQSQNMDWEMYRLLWEIIISLIGKRNRLGLDTTICCLQGSFNNRDLRGSIIGSFLQRLHVHPLWEVLGSSQFGH